MPKKKSDAEAGKSAAKAHADRETVRRYAAEMARWKADLRPYWTQMGKNEEMYEFYRSEYSETSSNVSLNTPFAIVEGQVARENRASVTVTVEAQGDGSLGEFEEWVAAVVKGAVEDRRVARAVGTFRKKKERWSRQLKVTGNAVAEAAYCYRKATVDGESSVTADNPYVINRHYTQVIFNPARQLDSSNVYYVEDHMRIEDMEAQAYSDGEGGRPTGKFRNLGDLRKGLPKVKAADWRPQADDDEVRYVAGDAKVAKKVEPVRVVTRWELKPAGWTRCVYADDRVMVVPDEVDPLRIGSHNLLIGMRYVVEGRPYAYGELDPIYKPVRAQDTIVNQKIEIINRYLRGSYVAGPSVDVDSLMMVLDQGGVMSGNGEEVRPVPVNLPPAQAFQEVQELQQAIERAARYSPYSSGTPNSSTDRTQGTKGGIVALQSAAEPNVEAQVDDVEEMFMTPYADIVLRMKAAYMSDDETVDALVEGKSREWVKVARGIIRGKATLRDFVTCGIIGEDEFESATTSADPATGQAVPIPGAADALVFDVGWVVTAKLSVQSAAEKANALSRTQQIVEFALEKLGAQFDPDRTTRYLAKEAGSDEIEDLLLTPEEKESKSRAAQEAQAAAQEAEVRKEAAVARAKAPAPADPRKESVSIAYKDVPVDVQRQMEAAAGFEPSRIHPQAAATLKQPLPAPPEPAPAGAPRISA